MKVMVMVKASAASEAGEMPSTELLAAMGKFNEELARAGIMLDGAGLTPSSKGARVRFSGSSRTVVNGPFAETKELVAGYWVWRVRNMQEAIEWVKRCPNPMPVDSEIEIRPYFEWDDFGTALTPELREQAAVVRAVNLGLGEPMLRALPQFVVAGISRHYTLETRSGIPDQWHEFVPRVGALPHRKGAAHYGVCFHSTADCAFDYLTGVEVSSTEGLPAGFTSLQLAASRYLVFTHAGHVSSLGATLDTIWTKWAPDCGLALAKAPCFERYTAEFNPDSGVGGMEIWIPLVA